MPLDLDMAELLNRLERAKAPEYPEMGAILARQFVDTNLPVIDVRPQSVHAVKEIQVDGWQGATLNARLYLPSEPIWAKPMPVLLWFHGGGFTIGSLDSYDAVCRTLCAGAEMAVLSVDYRLAPEHKFPTAAMDAFAAYQWLLTHASDYALDAQRIIIGGDSAGGTLSAVTCLQARDAGLPQPVLQLLIYPGTCGFGETAAYKRFGVGFRLTQRVIDWFFEQYLNSEDDRRDFRFAPLYAENHADLAPAWIAIAEYDPLADDGRLYADKLNAAGTPAELVQYDGVIHGFLNFGGVLKRPHELHQGMMAAMRTSTHT
ncbi:alpha/beta hydrolase [Hydromonas duriensis]|uniref:Acetyl esterase n=1 Tax=Hydromonas duriensis TaxID=1527608 RepID=A0A4V3DK62_9BURK|nr:alpha/beta hydrolase [Hydromonas duriensis]TDR32847.1 acetyl esterase [Hydromonas duriensis]